MRKHLPIGTLVLFATLLGAMLLGRYALTPERVDVPQELEGVVRPFWRTLQPFTLETQHREQFTESDLDDKWSFVFFGYTSCPDICPTTLVTLQRLSRDLRVGDAALARDTQVVFVAVDPDRDRTILSDYLAHFDREFIGITGTEPDLRRFGEQFGAMFVREPGDSEESYLVAHTSSVFLVGPDRQVIASFTPPHDEQTMASQFDAIRRLM